MALHLIQTVEQEQLQHNRESVHKLGWVFYHLDCWLFLQVCFA